MKKCIYAAKININQNIFHQDFDKLIPLIGKAILNSNGKVYETKKLKWTFTEVKDIILDDEKYIIGKLCKVKKSVSEKKFDENNHSTYWCEDKNIAYENMFLLDVSSEIIVFEDTTEIDKDSFIEKFERLCYLIDPTIGLIKIKFYPKSDDIDKILSNIGKIYYAKFNIIPANYTSKKGFAKLDETLKEEKIGELNITLKNEDGDISNEEDSIFGQCVEMVKSAYGTFKINAKMLNNKIRKRIDSECTIYKRTIDHIEDTRAYVSEFKNLIDNIKNDNDISNDKNRNL